MNIIVTTTQSVDEVSPILDKFLTSTDFRYVPRQKMGLDRLAHEHCADGVVVWESAGPVLYFGGEKLFFHPSMAKNRIAAYRKLNQQDLMIKACRLEPGWSFLDCTLGMGADAIVASYFSQNGRITGLESEKAVAAVIGWGMKIYRGRMGWLNQAINRIEVLNYDHRVYLNQLPERSYDVVYFDPMFEQPLLKSQPLNPLRKLANPAPINRETITTAARAARRLVVMKTLASGEEIERLNLKRISGSRHNPITYGVLEV